jgi:HK97 family phage major capsid protein
MDVLELRQKRATLIEEMRSLTRSETMNEEQVAKFDALQREVDGLDNQIVRVEQVASMEAALEQPASRAVKPGGKAPAHIKQIGDNEMRLFERWVRRGEDAVARELRASNDTDMNVGTAADGGVTVPTGLYNQIIARRDESSLHDRVGVMRIVGEGTSTDVPVDNENDGEFVATNEAAAADRDAPALNKVTLTKLDYTKQIQVSFNLLEDERSNVMQFLPNWVARGWAKTYNNLLITEALANGTAALTLDSATAIGAAEIPELVYKQPGEYAEGSVWIMKRATEGYIRGLASSNQFLFNPTPAGSDRGTPEIWGYPVHNTEKMTGIQASAKSMIFGNFGFMGMYEDPGLVFIRDPYSLAYLRQVRLIYYFRVDFGVLQAEAIHYATQPSA